MHDPTSSSSARIAFVGGGNMARSLIGGLVRQGHDAAAIRVAEPNAELRQALAQDFGVAVFEHGREAAAGADAVLLAVKPQVMRPVCESLREVLQADSPLLISIAAGIRMDQLEQWCGGGVAVVRSMPNTPALIGAGASGLCANARVSAAQRAQAEHILGAAGLTVWIAAEEQMDIVTAISGSGPAYFFRWWKRWKTPPSPKACRATRRACWPARPPWAPAACCAKTATHRPSCASA